MSVIAMFKKLHSPRARRQRLLLSIAANCRAGGSRLHCMEALAKKVQVFDPEDSLETSLMFYACEVPMDTADRLLAWMIAVSRSQVPLKVPFFHPRPLLEKAA